jgi:hypothetical protein
VEVTACFVAQGPGKIYFPAERVTGFAVCIVNKPLDSVFCNAGFEKAAAAKKFRGSSLKLDRKTLIYSIENYSIENASTKLIAISP